ncbi:clavaminate synthase-like protein [Tanacetum coccineum]
MLEFNLFNLIKAAKEEEDFGIGNFKGECSDWRSAYMTDDKNVAEESGSKNDKTQQPDSFATYGNSDPVFEYDALEDCLRIMDEECVIIPWKKGDVMLVNNLMVLHARQPLLKPPRRVLASLCM